MSARSACSKQVFVLIDKNILGHNNKDRYSTIVSISVLLTHVNNTCKSVQLSR